MKDCGRESRWRRLAAGPRALEVGHDFGLSLDCAWLAQKARCQRSGMGDEKRLSFQNR
jgi:predicted metalloprotease